MSRKLKLKKPFSFKPAKRCIYCGKEDIKLTKEHIIPKSLNGVWILPDASCSDCADITSKIELSVARDMYITLRTKANFKTGHKKKRPKYFEATINNNDGSQQKINIPVSKYPTLYPVLHLPPPGILSGKELSELNPEMKLSICGNPNEINELLTEYPEINDISFSVPKISWSDFFRVLAKIAHAITVGHYGTAGYTPLLPPLILGQNSYLSHLIGGKVETNDPKYLIVQDGYEISVGHEGNIIININIMGGRLPTYTVVSGQVTDWNAFLTKVSHEKQEEEEKYAHSMRTRFGYNFDWVHAINHNIRNIVHSNNPELIEHWPLLSRCAFEVYALPPSHYLFILKNSDNKEVDIVGEDGAINLPYDDYPSLPPNVSSLAAWEQWCRKRFELSHDQWPFILPIHDSGKTHGIAEDFKLYSEEDMQLWTAQLKDLFSLQLQQAIVNSRESMPEYAHGMRTRFGFTHQWVGKLISYIQVHVERNFHFLKVHWPLLSGYSFDAYALPPTHYLLILKNTDNEIPSGPDGAIVLPYNDHPAIPPKETDLDVWREWCQKRLLVAPDQWAILLPVHDAGWFHDENDDYALFSEDDRQFWDAQLRYLTNNQLKEVLNKLQDK